MFTPLSKDVARYMREGGRIEFIKSPGWDNYSISSKEELVSIPHNIIYTRHGHPLHTSIHLFYCYIISGKTMAVKDIEVTRNMLKRPMVYLFLEMSIDAIENLAKENKSNRLIITTKIPGFVEVAFERDFRIEQPEDKSYFKAAKRLN